MKGKRIGNKTKRTSKERRGKETERRQIDDRKGSAKRKERRGGGRRCERNGKGKRV